MPAPLVGGASDASRTSCKHSVSGESKESEWVIVWVEPSTNCTSKPTSNVPHPRYDPDVQDPSAPLERVTVDGENVGWSSMVTPMILDSSSMQRRETRHRHRCPTCCAVLLLRRFTVPPVPVATSVATLVQH